MRKPPSPEEKFSEIDSDGDGGVSFAEFSSDLQKMQSKMAESGMTPPPDAPEEMSSDQLEEMFAEADTDGDGVLSSDEFSAQMESLRPDPGVMQQMAADGMGMGNFDSADVLMEMMENPDDEESDSGSVSSYLSQMMQNAYGINPASQVNDIGTRAAVSSLLNVSA